VRVNDIFCVTQGFGVYRVVNCRTRKVETSVLVDAYAVSIQKRGSLAGLCCQQEKCIWEVVTWGVYVCACGVTSSQGM